MSVLNYINCARQVEPIHANLIAVFSEHVSTPSARRVAACVEHLICSTVNRRVMPRESFVAIRADNPEVVHVVGAVAASGQQQR
jgi:hypothetical protein